VRELLPTLEDWLAGGQPIARAVVIRTFGSSPRREGAVMLRAADGRLTGSVSGGCVEGATAERMEEAARSGLQRVVRFGVSDEDAWDVGLACGGTIDVLVQPAIPAEVLDAARASLLDRSAGRVIVTELPPGSPGAELAGSVRGPEASPPPPLVLDAEGRPLGGGEPPPAPLRESAVRALSTGASGLFELEGAQVFLEAFPPRPRLVIVGAGEVSAALVALAHELDYETVVVDARPAFATPERFPLADRLLVGWPDEVAGEIELGPTDALAVLSHDPKFDEPAIEVGLTRGCRYVGAIGSRKTQRARLERLRGRGLSDEQLRQLRGPIGLDLGGREPAETALAILSEIVADRYGGSAERMRDRSGAGG
jgi:xanthine dehydrogenase accessory factor